MTARFEEQTLQSIEKKDLVAKVAGLKKDGYRLAQVCATTLAENFEITYSFDKNLNMLSLRVMVPRADAVIPSITGEYFGAFTYENELQDLFGMKVTGLKLDFGGKFYQLAKKTPFNETKAEAVAIATAAANQAVNTKSGNTGEAK
jgi:ech hydrogenase subunit D